MKINAKLLRKWDKEHHPKPVEAEMGIAAVNQNDGLPSGSFVSYVPKPGEGANRVILTMSPEAFKALQADLASLLSSRARIEELEKEREAVKCHVCGKAEGLRLPICEDCDHSLNFDDGWRGDE